jgi:hypothetical protein
MSVLNKRENVKMYGDVSPIIFSLQSLQMYSMMYVYSQLIVNTVFCFALIGSIQLAFIISITLPSPEMLTSLKTFGREYRGGDHPLILVYSNHFMV